MPAARPVPAALALLLAAPAAARAQADSASLRHAVQAVPAGTPVRVELRGTGRFVAPIAGTMADGFALRDSSGGSRLIPYQNVTRFWVRQRAIGAGAITGAVVGVGSGILLGLFASAICESTDCPSAGEGAAIGGLVFGGIGTATGALIGAAIPRWSLRWQSGGHARGSTGPTSVSVPPAGTVPEVERRRIGEFTVAAQSGFGGFPPDSLTPDQGVLVGVMGSLALRAGRFAFGPEIGALFGEQPNWSFSGVARIDLSGTRRSAPTPYLVAGLGGFVWHRDNFESGQLTATLGLGVTTGARGRFEARWHPSVQNGVPQPHLFTVAAGYRFVW